MKNFTNLKNGVPQGGINVIIEAGLLRIFFDYEKDETVREDIEGNAVANDNAYKCELVEVQAPHTYPRIVSAIVDDRYSASDVTAIIANHALAADEKSDITEEKRAEYLQDYTTFQELRSHAKEVAKNVLNLI